MVVSGTKMKPLANPLMMFGMATDDHGNAEIDVAQQQSRIAEDAEATRQQQAAVDIIHQRAHHDHGEHGAKAARTYRQAAIERRISHQRLQKQRQHGRDAIEHKTVRGP